MPAKKEETKKKQMTQLSLATATEDKEKNTIHKRAGLLFPVSRVLRLMKQGRYADRISTNSAIAITSVLEYLTAEVIEVSGGCCYDGDKLVNNVIKPRHICLGIKADEEMSRAIGSHVIIPMGGVIPFIHQELDQKPRRRNTKMDQFKDDQAEAEEDSEEDESMEEDEG
jgi:histone H2A